LDALDHLDSAWETPGREESESFARDSAENADVVDDAALGHGLDAQLLWGDASIALPEVTTVSPTPAASTEAIDALEPPMDRAGLAGIANAECVLSDAGLDVGWDAAPSIPSADAVIADHPDAVHAVCDSMTMSPAPEPTAEVEQPWPDPLLAEYAPYIPAPVVASAESAEPASVLAERADLASEPAVEIDPRTAQGRRVSAALDRLAARVRDGEIDVSFVASEAPDAAVLASVLAALLGGSSTR
jgi:hypothetical protein